MCAFRFPNRIAKRLHKFGVCARLKMNGRGWKHLVFRIEFEPATDVVVVLAHVGKPIQHGFGSCGDIGSNTRAPIKLIVQQRDIEERATRKRRLEVRTRAVVPNDKRAYCAAHTTCHAPEQRFVATIAGRLQAHNLERIGVGRHLHYLDCHMNSLLDNNQHLL